MAQKYTAHKKFKIVQDVLNSKKRKQRFAYYDISCQTFYNWKQKLEQNNWDWKCLEYESRKPKTSPHQTVGETVERILALRAQGFGRDRIVAYLRRKGFLLGKSAVEGVLKREDAWNERKKKKRKRYYGKHVATIKKPGERLQMDVKHMGAVEGRKHYQYTIVDLYTRMTFRYAYESYTGDYTVDFVKRAMNYFPFALRTIQTDNGVEFTFDKMTLYNKEHPLDVFLREQKIRHTLTPVATPRYNGMVENVHGRDEQEVYARKLLRGKTIDALPKFFSERNHFWNYTRLHSGIGYVTPIERLKEYERNRPQVKYVPR